MALTTQDVARLAELARLELNEAEARAMLDGLNDILKLAETLKSVDTEGVEPLTHPLDILEDVTLRLRDDEPEASGDTARRERLMANAPEQQDGLFLVPRVLE